MLEALARNLGIEELCLKRGLGAGIISHGEFKKQLPAEKVIVRTGEVTPYANVILHCGVDF